ncbi:MAG: hypothetical protein ACRDMJ_10165, partial [Solirubrobacteraceae bacterium]
MVIRRAIALGATAGAVAVLFGAALVGPAAAAAGGSAGQALPAMNVALTGTHGVAVSGSTVSGAVTIASTYSGHGHGLLGIIRLDPGVTIQQAAGAVNSAHGNLDALTPYATLLVSTGAPSTVQTVFTPGSYVALNITGNGQPAFATFTVTQAAAPATLPRARTTQSAIEFAFRGPSVLHDGTIVRARNDGYLVHMITLIGARNRATGKAIVSLLRAGHDRAAQRLASHSSTDLLGPASPGAMQQQVLQVKPGYYVEACFMDTGDGREHTRLG